MTYIELEDHKSSPMNIPLVRQVVEAARSDSVDVYLVGGYLRDLLWERENSHQKKDLDFAVAGVAALEFARRLASCVNGHFVVLDENFDTARVVLSDGTYVDFTGCFGGTIEHDVKRRDFTVNALAFDCSKPDCILDLVGGVEDVKRRLIRAVSYDVLVDDPLRLLRAFRFKALLRGAKMEAQTFQWIRQLAPKIKEVAAERINTEMFMLLTAQEAGSILCEMGETGLLEAIYPELIDTRKVTANDFHHLNLFDHSIEAVTKLEANLARLPLWALSQVNDELSFGVTRLAAAKLATLLHDIGKPKTWQINEDGRHSFYGHDKVGAEMADLMAERMKWSRPVGRFISKLILAHLRPGALFHQGPPTERALQRFYRKMGQDMPELIALSLGDLAATCGAGLPEPARVELACKLVGLLDGYKDFLDEVMAKPKFLTGEDVMNILDISPGPRVGEILEALAEAQGLKEVVDRQSAERFVIEFGKKR